MRKLVLFLLLIPLFAFSQTPRAEVFGGYSLLHAPSQNFQGWNGAATLNIYRCLGITADFSGHYWSQSLTLPLLGPFETKMRIYSYTFGPTVALRNKTRFTPFTRLLLGGARQTFSLSSPSVTGSDNRFTVVGGGGLDITLNQLIAVRPVQLDYQGIKIDGSWMNNMRYSAGVVFRFGEKK